MSMTADQIVDRRRLRRKLSFWRILGFLLLLLLIGGAIVAWQGRDAFPLVAEDQIARVSVSGFIASDRDRLQMLDKLAKADSVKGVIVAIDSTGGATVGGEELYEGLRKLAAKKPTVATIGTVGASAAYMTAIATDHIVARRTSITGSIGVIFEYPEVSQLLDKLGVRVEEQKSAPLKAEPSPFRPASDEAKAVIQGVIKDSFDWFVSIVAERRNLSPSDALIRADGRIYSGQQALEAKLVDEIGGEDKAIAWLGTKGVDTRLPVRDWEPKRPSRGVFPFANAVAAWIAQQVGISPSLVPDGVLDRILPENLRLDGLRSVWQGSAGGDLGPAQGAAR
jgi:protease-4